MNFKTIIVILGVILSMVYSAHSEDEMCLLRTNVVTTTKLSPTYQPLFQTQFNRTSMINAATQLADKVLGKAPTAERPQPRTDPSKPMHALIWNGAKDIEYIETPRPMLTDPEDIVLKITATTICGSDLHLYTNAMLDMHKGDILGHEFMGIVDEVGPEVKNLKKGDRVVVAFGICCGRCDFCKREEYTACDKTNPSKLVEAMYGARPAALYGYSHLTGGIPGGQADYVRVPFADYNCLVVPEDVPDDKALYLSDIVPTALHGVVLADVKEGSTVAIWGLGPVGLLAARWAQIKGAKTVIGVDCIKERLDIAKKVLGIETVNFNEEDTCKSILAKVPGGVDCSIECAGFEYSTTWKSKIERALMLQTDTADIFTEMFFCTRKFGSVSIIGVYSGYANHFPVGAMMEKDLIIKGGQSPTQKYWKYCLEKYRSGEMDPLFVVDTRATLKDGPKLYDQFYDKKILKVFLRP